MDLQAAETSHLRDKQPLKKSWNCPCTGCTKAVKQERERILYELNLIELDTPSQLNAVGLKQLITEIIKAGGK